MTPGPGSTGAPQ
ncbi:hypothetical protein M1B34_33310 [Pseudomonas sp. MAFF 302030]|uniref:Uncharacterized protein n=1 Tax=Pseudomonas morbosilactucae TaxID=2938197 RepID=A0A9X1Z1U9_9PSED|nr:hypothetical protein [Pseudomonas morbosilactucae]MCK9802393.1 hypothetical protein [Pseudomonas morbosilactucae]